MEIVRCKRCNRVLTSKESIKLGYGKKCYQIVQLHQEKNNVVQDTDILERIR